MKGKFLLLILFLAFAATGYSQRHIKGIKSLNVNVGLTKLGWYGELGYSQMLTNKSYVKASILRETGKLNSTIPFNSYVFSVSYNHTIWKPTEWMFLNGTVGAMGVSDNIKPGEVTLGSAKNNSFNYGGFLGGEVEAYFNDRIIFLLNFRQSYLLQNQLGHYVYYAGAGLRFNLY